MYVIGTGCPIFRQVKVIIDLVEMSHRRSGFQIAAPLLLWLSTVNCAIDLTTRANSYLRIEGTSKNKKEHNLEYCG